MQSHLRAALVLTLAVTAAFAEPRGGRRLPPGANVHPEGTAGLYRSIAIARELRGKPGELGARFETLPREIKEIAANLTDAQLKTLGDYEVLARSTNPRVRQAALEQLHRTFWEVIPEARVAEIGKFSEVSRLTTDAITRLSEGRVTDPTMKTRIETVVAEVNKTAGTRAAERNLDTMRTQALDAALESGSPGITRDMVSFVRQDGMLGGEAGRLLSPMTNLVKESNAAMKQPAIANNPANKAFMERAVRTMSDYAMIHEDPAGVVQTAEMFAGVIKGAGTTGNLASVDGMMRLLAGPVEAARAELIARASKEGVLNGLKSKIKAELEAEGKKPTEREIESQLSLRDLREAIEQKLVDKHGAKPETLDNEIKALDGVIKNSHDKAVAEALTKLILKDGKIDASKLGILKRLFGKSRKGTRPCLSNALRRALVPAAAVLGAAALPGVSKADQALVQKAINESLVPCSLSDETKCPELKELDPPASNARPATAKPQPVGGTH